MAYVDQDLCISCGMCVSLEPNVFAFNEDEKAECIASITDETSETAKQAAEDCPVDAIRLDD